MRQPWPQEAAGGWGRRRRWWEPVCSPLECVPPPPPPQRRAGGEHGPAPPQQGSCGFSGTGTGETPPPSMQRPRQHHRRLPRGLPSGICDRRPLGPLTRLLGSPLDPHAAGCVVTEPGFHIGEGRCPGFVTRRRPQGVWDETHCPPPLAWTPWRAGSHPPSPSGPVLPLDIPVCPSGWPALCQCRATPPRGQLETPPGGPADPGRGLGPSLSSQRRRGAGRLRDGVQPGGADGRSQCGWLCPTLPVALAFVSPAARPSPHHESHVWGTCRSRLPGYQGNSGRGRSAAAFPRFPGIPLRVQGVEQLSLRCFVYG